MGTVGFSTFLEFSKSCHIATTLSEGCVPTNGKFRYPPLSHVTYFGHHSVWPSCRKYSWSIATASWGNIAPVAQQRTLRQGIEVDDSDATNAQVDPPRQSWANLDWFVSVVGLFLRLDDMFTAC